MVQTRNSSEGATPEAMATQLNAIMSKLETMNNDIVTLKAQSKDKGRGNYARSDESDSNWRHFPHHRPYNKIDFPSFNGGDPRGWILKAEKYFNYYNIPDQEKVDVAALHLEGDALDLYSWLSSDQPLSFWEEMVHAFQKNFGPAEFQNPDEHLCSIKQTGSVQEYRQEFAKRSSRVSNWPDHCLLGVFLNGLKEELKSDVRIHKPRTVYSAMSLALEYENKVNHKQPFKSAMVTAPIKSESSSSSSNPFTAAGTPQKSTEFRISETEKQGRLLRGECFRCGDKYSPGHRCKTGNFKLLEAAGEELEPGVQRDVNQVDITEETAEISLHALYGEPHTTTMKFHGSMHNTKVLILIDSGSTHNFISDMLVLEMKLLTQFVTPFGVQIGNGDIIRCNRICKDISIQLCDLTITQDFFPFALGGADVVLGIQWLSTLNTIQANWKDMFLVFFVAGKTHRLQGSEVGKQAHPTFQQLHIGSCTPGSSVATAWNSSYKQSQADGKMQCWVFDTGSQRQANTTLVRLEDKSSLRAGSNDTNLLISDGLELLNGLKTGSKKSG